MVIWFGLWARQKSELSDGPYCPRVKSSIVASPLQCKQPRYYFPFLIPRRATLPRAPLRPRFYSLSTQLRPSPACPLFPLHVHPIRHEPQSPSLPLPLPLKALRGVIPLSRPFFITVQFAICDTTSFFWQDGCFAII